MATHQRYARLMAYLAPPLEPWRPSMGAWRHAVANGAFADEHVELLDGAVVAMSPRDPAHEYAIAFLLPLVARAAAPPLTLRVAGSLSLADGWEPEPDLAVVADDGRRDSHPATARWVCEVANSSLRVDRLVKAPAYARAGIPEYWIVDLVARLIEVRTAPTPDRGYTSIRSHAGPGVLSSVQLPGLGVDVGALFADALPAPA